MARALALVLAGWLAGCATAPLNAPMPAGDATLYVVGRGWHTDIALPVNEVGAPLDMLEHDFPGVQFMVFGFGERRFYMAQHARSGDMLTALFPSKSVVLMTALRAPPDQAFAEYRLVTLHVPQQTVDRIGARLWRTLETTPDGRAIRLSDGPYAGSAFYAAWETYDAFYTCNTWTARVLRDGGVPVDPRGVVFADQLMQQVSELAMRQGR